MHDAVSLVDVAPTLASLSGSRRFDADGRVILPPEGGHVAGGGGGSEAPRGALRRVVRAAARFRLEPAAHDPQRRLEIHRGAEAGAVRRDARSGRDAQPGERTTGARRRTSRGRSTPSRTAAAARPRAPRRRIARRWRACRRSATRADVPEPAAARPDPKDRRELAARDRARHVRRAAGGRARARAARSILKDDPRNPQANLRLGYVLLESGRCARGDARSSARRSTRTCRARMRISGAPTASWPRRIPPPRERTLTAAQDVEPDNPVVSANLGLVLSDSGKPAAGDPAPAARALARSGSPPGALRARSRVCPDQPADRGGEGSRRNCSGVFRPTPRSGRRSSACWPPCGIRDNQPNHSGFEPNYGLVYLGRVMGLSPVFSSL